MATTWGPDSCECRITYDMAADGETLIYVGTPSTCALHVGLAGATLLSVLLSENQTKNRMAHEILQRVPRLGKTITDEYGGTRVDWADDVSFNWSFTGQGNSRQLRVEVIARPPLNGQEKGQIRAASAGMSTAVNVI